jgi:hypothetical protein
MIFNYFDSTKILSTGHGDYKNPDSFYADRLKNFEESYLLLSESRKRMELAVASSMLSLTPLTVKALNTGVVAAFAAPYAASIRLQCRSEGYASKLSARQVFRNCGASKGPDPRSRDHHRHHRGVPR